MKDIYWKFAVILILIASFSVSGCAYLQQNPGAAKIPVEYAVMKVIEDSDSISADDVISNVGRIRNIISEDQQIQIDEAVSIVREQINWNSLSPADQSMLELLISQCVSYIRSLDLVPEQTRVSILELLSWIDEAARMSNGQS